MRGSNHVGICRLGQFLFISFFSYLIVFVHFIDCVWTWIRQSTEDYFILYLLHPKYNTVNCVKTEDLFLTIWPIL